MKSLPLILFLTLGLAVSTGARAEKADAKQPTNIEADQMNYDDVSQVNTFIGNVRMTRGSLIMKGHKMVLKQDAAGYQYGTLYAPAGGLASFRQKRDGGPNLWIEGYAVRMEYDGKTEVSKLFTRAKLKRLDGTKVTDEVDGEYISYDAKTEFYSVNNSATGVSKPGAGRIKVVIQPRDENKSKGGDKAKSKSANKPIVVDAPKIQESEKGK
jgi:lipopolysaccharide export system protein LptA